jgi:hypothetical protein
MNRGLLIFLIVIAVASMVRPVLSNDTSYSYALGTAQIMTRDSLAEVFLY